MLMWSDQQIEQRKGGHWIAGSACAAFILYMSCLCLQHVSWLLATDMKSAGVLQLQHVQAQAVSQDTFSNEAIA